jgi:hypothetical protein
MAFLELESTAARAWFVTTNLGESLSVFLGFGIQDLHYLSSREPATNQLGHYPQRSVDVLKKRFVSSAKIIQANLTILRH